MQIINQPRPNWALVFIIASCLGVSQYLKKIQGNENELSISEQRQLRARSRTHKLGKFMLPNTLDRFSSVAGINEMLNNIELKLPGTNQEIDLPLGAKLILSNFRCDSFMMEDFDHTFSMNAKNTDATTDIFVEGIGFGCAASYQYQHGRFIRRPKGTVHISAKSTLDAQATIFSSDFESALPKKASVTSCTADTEIDLDFSGSMASGLLNMFSNIIELGMKTSTHDILCNTLEKSGGAVMTSFFDDIASTIDPFINDQARGITTDKLGPQKSLDTSAKLLDFTNESLHINYDNFNDFANDYKPLITHTARTLKEISTHHRLSVPSSRLDHGNRLLQMGVTESIISMVASAIVKTLFDIIQEFLVNPDDLVGMITDFLMGLVGGGTTGFRRLQEENNCTLFGILDGGDWKIDLFNLPFMPSRVESSRDLFQVNWKGATISGTPVEDFHLKPIGKQTLDTKLSVPDVNVKADIEFKMDKDFIIDNPALYLKIPRTEFEMRVESGIENAFVETVFMIAFNFFLGQITATEEVLSLVCEFFPVIQIAFLEVSGTFKSPIISGSFGKGEGFDDLVNGIVGPLFRLFRGFYMNATRNFLGTQARVQINDVVNMLLQMAEEQLTSVCPAGFNNM